MKLLHLFLSIFTLWALIPWAAPVQADDLFVPSRTFTVPPDTVDHDHDEGIVFDRVTISAGIHVTAKAAYEVTLKPGTSIKAGARFVVTMKDKDGLPNRWEVEFCNTMSHGPGSDPDADGLDMLSELQIGTHPCAQDTDGDGMPDGREVRHNLNPLADDAHGDADRDGLPNVEELARGTDPRNPDTDGDGMPDGYEVENGLDPFVDDANGDADFDGISNIKEYRIGTLANDPGSRPVPHTYTYDNNGNLEQTEISAP